MEIRDILPLLGMPVMLIAVQIGGLLLSPSMQEAGYAAFEDPSSVANPLYIIVLLLAFTFVLLMLIRRHSKRVIGAIIAFSIFLTFVYVFSAVSLRIFGSGTAGGAIAFLFAVGATALLYRYPEWYVVDILGVLISAGIVSIFGISLEVLPVIVLLLILAVYDAISVYKTKHMLTLADSVMELKTPILVIIPKSLDYSYIRDGLSIQEESEERGAFMMGLGDLIMPSILVVSAQVFLNAPRLLGLISIPSLGAMLGTLAGLTVLIHFVQSGRPQAGLPTLNGGAICGFLIGCALTGAWGWLPGI